MSNDRVGNAKGQKEIAAERAASSFELRKSGLPYREIGRRLGVSEAQAHRDVTKVLKRLIDRVSEDAVKMRVLESERLDMMTAVTLVALTSQDAGERLAAVDRMLRVQARRSALFGLDAPERKDFTSGGEAIRLLVEYTDKPKTNEPESNA